VGQGRTRNGSDRVQDAKVGKKLTGAVFTGKGNLAYLASSEHVMIGKQNADVTISVGEPSSSCQQRLIEKVTTCHLLCPPRPAMGCQAGDLYQ
jgi:hypothetical protein